MKYSVLTLPQPRDGSRRYKDPVPVRLRHPLYGWLGLRPVLAQHMAAEHAAIRKWAAAKTKLVEIGVAEGISALAAREVMADNAKLYLIDPFHLSRIPACNFMKRTARRVVERCTRGTVTWIEKFSSDAAPDWTDEIDFLFIDGDHSETTVRKDWEEWNHFVVPGGVDLFRRGRLPGWTIVDEVDSIVVVEKSKL